MLYSNLFYDQRTNNLFSDTATIGYMLQFEAALASAQAQHGVIPVAAAQTISHACKSENINLQKLIPELALGGNANIPLIQQLTAFVKKKDPEAAKYVHIGATSQDVIDTAIALQTRDALRLMSTSIDELIVQLTTLAKAHKSTLMIGRSFMQQARPITFGYKVATWLDGVLRSKQRIHRILHESAVLSFGGAVGTLAGMHDQGMAIAKSMAEALGLQNPSIPSHTQRDRQAEVAATLGILVGTLSKIAKDVSLLMQTEIGEVFESSIPGKGGSSAMPHKRNPVTSIAILSIATRTPALVSTMLSCMTQDHERATGPWHAEWETIAQLIQLTAGALRQSLILTNGLEVDKDKMLQNINATNGLIFAENIVTVLADTLGKAEAHHLIELCCKQASQQGQHLKTVISDHPLLSGRLASGQIDSLFDPSISIGQSVKFIERVLLTV